MIDVLKNKLEQDKLALLKKIDTFKGIIATEYFEMENNFVNKQKIKFIVNPISGGKSKSNIEKIVENKINLSKYAYEIVYTKYRCHATELAQKALEQGFDIIIAVGGDGTVNEIARVLVNKNVLFGIIPTGSGDGLARFFKIPSKPEKAVKVINKCNHIKMDAVQVNDDFFVNMAGVGFDAHISHLFATSQKRGFKSYVKLIIKEFKTYKNQTYQLVFDNQTINEQAFLISFANSSQFGNNAHIAPLAEINDGLIDVCILKRFPLRKAPLVALQLYTKQLVKSAHYKVIKARELEISAPKNLKMHIDGDPITFNSIVKMKIHPQSLNIIVP